MNELRKWLEINVLPTIKYHIGDLCDDIWIDDNGITIVCINIKPTGNLFPFNVCFDTNEFIKNNEQQFIDLVNQRRRDLARDIREVANRLKEISCELIK